METPTLETALLNYAKHLIEEGRPQGAARATLLAIMYGEPEGAEPAEHADGAASEPAGE